MKTLKDCLEEERARIVDTSEYCLMEVSEEELELPFNMTVDELRKIKKGKVVARSLYSVYLLAIRTDYLGTRIVVTSLSLAELVEDLMSTDLEYGTRLDREILETINRFFGFIGWQKEGSNDS